MYCYVTVVSLQYLTPLILTLNCTLLLKTLGENRAARERGGAGPGRGRGGGGVWSWSRAGLGAGVVMGCERGGRGPEWIEVTVRPGDDGGGGGWRAWLAKAGEREVKPRVGPEDGVRVEPGAGRVTVSRGQRRLYLHPPLPLPSSCRRLLLGPGPGPHPVPHPVFSPRWPGRPRGG